MSFRKYEKEIGCKKDLSIELRLLRIKEEIRVKSIKASSFVFKEIQKNKKRFKKDQSIDLFN